MYPTSVKIVKRRIEPNGSSAVHAGRHGFGVRGKVVRFRRNAVVRRDSQGELIGELRRSTSEDTALSRTPKPPKPWHPFLKLEISVSTLNPSAQPSGNPARFSFRQWSLGAFAGFPPTRERRNTGFDPNRLADRVADMCLLRLSYGSVGMHRRCSPAR